MTVLTTVANAAEATAVLPAAAAEAARRNSDLHVLNLTHGRDTQALTAALDAARAELGPDGRAVVAGPSIPDHAAAARVAAGAIGAAVLVIGVRRRSPVGKLVMGSVAQTILLDADCPVLAVRV